MKKVHAKHGRDHAPGGSDPIPGFSSSMWANMTDVTNYTVTGASYDRDVYSTVMDYSQSADSTSVFAEYEDSNGVEGISCLTPEDSYLYLLQWSFEIAAYDTGASNTGFLLPPRIRIGIDYCPDTGDFDGDSNPLAIDAETMVWQAAEWAYNPPVEFNQVFTLAGRLFTPISAAFGAGEPVVLAPRITVDDGAHQYQWGNVGFLVVRAINLSS